MCLLGMSLNWKYRQRGDLSCRVRGHEKGEAECGDKFYCHESIELQQKNPSDTGVRRKKSRAGAGMTRAIQAALRLPEKHS